MRSVTFPGMFVRSSRKPLFPPVCTPLKFISLSMSVAWSKPWKPTVKVSAYPSSYFETPVATSFLERTLPGRKGKDSFVYIPRGSRFAERCPLT